MSEEYRSETSVLLLGYLTGTVLSREFLSFFKVKEIRARDGIDGSPPRSCEIEFASGTTVRIRVEDVK